MTPLQPGPADGQTPGANGTPFDAQAFLATLPAEDQAELAQLSPEALERYSKRTMLQSDYSRKRGEEAERLRQLEERMTLLQNQNLMAAQLLERQQAGAAQPQGPSLDEAGKALFEAENHQQYIENLFPVVDQRVSAAVESAIENHPVIRQVRAGAALRSYRGSAPDTTEADVAAGREALASRLRSEGADPADFNEKALLFMLQPEVEAARAQRLLQQARAGGQPTPAAPTPGRRTALPVSGHGATAPTVSASDKPGHGPDSTLQSRMESTLRQFNMSPGDMARLIRESL